MAKLDYKKLYQQQKRQNILLRTENERLIGVLHEVRMQKTGLEMRIENNSNNAASWEQLRNMKAGEAEGIMRCFEKLLDRVK